MEKSFFESQKNRLRLFLILVAFLAASVLLSANISASSLTKVYDTKIVKVTTDDTGDWTVKGTTKAPSGTKVYATTTVKSDESYGTNSGSNLDQTTWSKVNHGKFTISVDPVDLSDSTSYKAGKKFRVYIFAAKGGIKSFIDSSTTKPLSKKSMQKVSKTVTKRMLVLTKSQAKYLNDLFSDSSDSSSSSSSESSVASSSSTPQSSSSSAQSSSTSVPKEYKSALNSADIYANTMHMSKAGLYEQLTADAGDEFSPEAAQYAVDNVKTDWNKNALESAKSYQEMDMSPESIREQLTSDAGEKFTQEQADYAVANLPQ